MIMKKKDKNIPISVLSKRLGEVKIDDSITSIANSECVKKKMEKGAKTLASCPLPK
jgi:hypothetical protein